AGAVDDDVGPGGEGGGDGSAVADVDGRAVRAGVDAAELAAEVAASAEDDHARCHAETSYPGRECTRGGGGRAMPPAGPHLRLPLGRRSGGVLASRRPACLLCRRDAAVPAGSREGSGMEAGGPAGGRTLRSRSDRSSATDGRAWRAGRGDSHQATTALD